MATKSTGKKAEAAKTPTVRTRKSRKKPEAVPITVPLKNRNEKKTCKLGKEHVNLIIEMTVAGYTDGDIMKELKDTHGISITSGAICYQRRQNADRLEVTEADQIRAARARSSYMQLATRIAALERAIDKELKKKNSSGYAISMLMSTMDQTISKVENLRLKREELARRAGANNGDIAHEEYVKDMETRSRLIRSVQDGEATILNAGAVNDLVVLPPTAMESTENRKEPDPIFEEDDEDGLFREESGTSGGLEEADLRA